MEPHEQRLVLALRTLNSELAGSNRVVADRLDLNDSDLAVLDLLHRSGPQSPTSLAKRTRMSTTTMASILRRLERDGWVERRVNPDDLRSFTIHPTSIERLADTFLAANERLGALLGERSVQESQAIIDFLDQAAAIIRSEADQLSAPVNRTTTSTGRDVQEHRTSA